MSSVIDYEILSFDFIWGTSKVISTTNRLITEQLHPHFNINFNGILFMWKKIKDMFKKFIGKIMENKYMIFLKYLLSEFISWAKTSEGVIFIVVWATIAYVIYTFNTQIMYWYNDNIIPFLDLIESNILLYLLTLIILIYFFGDIYKKCKVCYQFDKHLIFALLFLFTELIVCRLSEDYDYHYIIKCISLSYVDVITIFCFGYLYVAIHHNMF